MGHEGFSPVHAIIVVAFLLVDLALESLQDGIEPGFFLFDVAVSDVGSAGESLAIRLLRPFVLFVQSDILPPMLQVFQRFFQHQLQKCIYNLMGFIITMTSTSARNSSSFPLPLLPDPLAPNVLHCSLSSTPTSLPTSCSLLSYLQPSIPSKVYLYHIMHFYLNFSASSKCNCSTHLKVPGVSTIRSFCPL